MDFKKIIVLLMLSFFTSAAMAENFKAFGVGFAAPAINGETNVVSPEIGAMIFDYASGQFKGYNGSSWSPFAASPSPRNEIFVDSGNGYGSSATKVRRFSNTRKSTGSAITYSDSSVEGGVFTINEDGIYSINYSDYSTSTVTYLAITVNTTATTTSASSLTYADGRRMGTNTSAASTVQMASWTGFLQNGDVVKAMTSGSANATDAFVAFSIAQVSK